MSKDTSKTIIIHYAKVISIDDEKGGDRIKVKIRNVDDKKSLKEIPYCFPAMPKMFHVKPKVGESVLVFLQEENAYGGDRFYMGPIIAQPYFMDYQDAEIGKMLLNGKQTYSPIPNPSTNSNIYGVLPNDDDIAIEGRNNADVVLKDNEVRLRCGFKTNQLKSGDVTSKLEANKVDPAYIQMQYKNRKDEKLKDYNSSINIVGDRINLLSHDSRVTFSPTNYDQSKKKDELISDEEMNNILNNAHPLVYGDDIVNFLKRFLVLFQTHVHPYHGMPPALSGDSIELLQTDLDKFLSKSIKIN